MKKSAAILGVVVVLGVAYAGSSWYVGKRAQDTIEQVVARDNKEFLKMLGPDLAGSGLTLAIDDYKRGVFSSDAVYSLRFNDKDGKPVVIKFSDHLEHGPFPAARLKEGTFAPLMAVSDARLVATPATQKWFDALEDKSASPVSALTTIAFSGTGHSAWQIKPLAITEDGRRVVFSGGAIDVDLSNDYRDKTVAGQFSSLDVTDEAGKLALKGIKIDSKTAWTEPETTVTHAGAVIDSLSLDSDDGHPLAIDNWAVDLDSTQIGNFLDGALLYKLGHIKVGQSDMGSLEAGGKVAHLDMVALAALSAEYNKQASKEDKGETADSDRGQAAALRDKLRAVLASNPVVSIDPFKWKTDKGETTLLVKVQLTDPQGRKPAQYIELLLGALKDVAIDLSLSEPMMAQLISEALAADGQTPPPRFAETMAKKYADRLIGAGMVEPDGENLVSKIHFHGNVVELNGQTMTPAELAQRVAMMLMLRY